MKTELKTKEGKVYLVWVNELQPYWKQYTTLEAAVSGNTAPVEVYEAQPVLLGLYAQELRVVLVNATVEAPKS